MGFILGLDYQLFEYFNGWAGKNAVFDASVVFFGHWAVYALGLVLVLAWFFNYNKLKTRQALVMAFISFVVARFGVTEIIRMLFPRPRPFLSHSVFQLIAKGNEQSFPSGHATALFAIAMAVYFYHKKSGIWLFVVAAVVSLARIIAGVHYPLDILGGAVVGVFTALLIEKFLGSRLKFLAQKFSDLTDKIASKVTSKKLIL